MYSSFSHQPLSTSLLIWIVSCDLCTISHAQYSFNSTCICLNVANVVQRPSSNTSDKNRHTPEFLLGCRGDLGVGLGRVDWLRAQEAARCWAFFILVPSASQCWSPSVKRTENICQGRERETDTEIEREKERQRQMLKINVNTIANTQWLTTLVKRLHPGEKKKKVGKSFNQGNKVYEFYTWFKCSALGLNIIATKICLF